MAITSPLRYPRTRFSLLAFPSFLQFAINCFRSRCMACALLCFVWVGAKAILSFTKQSNNPLSPQGMSLVVCSPPWFVDEWAIHFQDSKTSMGPAAAVSSSASSLSRVGNKRAKSFVEDSGLHPQPAGAYQCAYPMSVSYRIYSASVSFYIPLVVRLTF